MPDEKARILVVATDEERMIAREVVRCLVGPTAAIRPPTAPGRASPRAAATFRGRCRSRASTTSPPHRGPLPGSRPFTSRSARRDAARRIGGGGLIRSSVSSAGGLRTRSTRDPSGDEQSV